MKSSVWIITSTNRSWQKVLWKISALGILKHNKKHNLAKTLEKYVWRSSFLVNFQACSLIVDNYTNRWTPLQVFFNSILSPPMLPPCIDSSSAPSNLKSCRMFSTPVWKPCIHTPNTQRKITLERVSMKISDMAPFLKTTPPILPTLLFLWE